MGRLDKYAYVTKFHNLLEELLISILFFPRISDYSLFFLLVIKESCFLEFISRVYFWADKICKMSLCFLRSLWEASLCFARMDATTHKQYSRSKVKGCLYAGVYQRPSMLSFKLFFWRWNLWVVHPHIKGHKPCYVSRHWWSLFGKGTSSYCSRSLIPYVQKKSFYIHLPPSYFNTSTQIMKKSLHKFATNNWC